MVSSILGTLSIHRLTKMMHILSMFSPLYNNDFGWKKHRQNAKDSRRYLSIFFPNDVTISKTVRR